MKKKVGKHQEGYPDSQPARGEVRTLARHTKLVMSAARASVFAALISTLSIVNKYLTTRRNWRTAGKSGEEKRQKKKKVRENKTRRGETRRAAQDTNI